MAKKFVVALMLTLLIQSSAESIVWRKDNWNNWKSGDEILEGWNAVTESNWGDQNRMIVDDPYADDTETVDKVLAIFYPKGSWSPNSSKYQGRSKVIQIN
jgi:hypothetical protein